MGAQEIRYTNEVNYLNVTAKLIVWPESRRRAMWQDFEPNPVDLGPNPVVLGPNQDDLGPNPVVQGHNPVDLGPIPVDQNPGVELCGRILANNPKLSHLTETSRVFPMVEAGPMVKR